jgi:hypothetical protein
VDTYGDPHDALAALAMGAWRQIVLATIRRLDLITLLGARSADLEEVCYSLGTQRYPTLLLLSACEGLGLVLRRDDAYVLGPAGRPVYEAGGATLVDWAEATVEPRSCDAVVAALRGDPAPGAAGPAGAAVGLPDQAAADARDAARAHQALAGLHAGAAATLAARLRLRAGALVVEMGGQGIFAAALLAQEPELSVAIPQAETAAPDAAGRLGQTERARLVDGADPAFEPAQLGVVAQLHPAEGRAALWERIENARAYLAADGPLAVVGPFLTLDAGGRTMAPLLALAALAAGGSVWCPTVDAVAEGLRARGYARVETIVLPEPDAAAIGYPSG